MADASLLEKSKTFCMLPWVHMNVATDGRALPCCVSDWDRPVGNIRQASLRELWNSEGMRRRRKDMLAGTEIAECRYCRHMERGGFPSLRQYANKRFAHHFPEVDKTGPDGSLQEMRLPFMDIRFSNVCNFRCRICYPMASSSWHKEAGILWGYSAPKVLTPTEDPKDLWRQIEPLIPDLEEIWFAGGEPLMNEEHYLILDLLAKNKLFNVQLRYNTNLSIMTHHGKDVMKMWDQFSSVEVKASLDGMGRRGEYLRKGMVWEQVLKNRKRMAEICPRTEFVIDATVCLMNALHLPDFHREWLAGGLVNPGCWRPHLLESPEEYSIQALPAAFKRQVMEKYECHIEGALKSLGSAQDEPIYRSILSFMSVRDKSGLLPKFREKTLDLDRLRGEKFSEIFPELASLMRE